MIRPLAPLRSTNFGREARAYDEDAIPAHALAAHKAVQEAKRPNILGTATAQWNASTDSGVRFPDRPMMRTLSKYDSHKRADNNCERTETLTLTLTLTPSLLPARQARRRDATRACARRLGVRIPFATDRREELDWRETKMYVPTTNKFQVTGSTLTLP